MSNVINRKTKQYLKSVNTPNYPIKDWIINPILPDCNPKYYVIENDIVKEMTQVEKNNLVYSTKSSVYLIIEKQLLTNVNGHDYEGNSNAIINPIMPNCDIKYTKVVNSNVIEITTEEKYVIDLPDLKREWIKNITDEVYKSHSVEEIAFTALLISVDRMSKTGIQATSIRDTVIDALELYPKP
ncbi:hypothetical protein GQ473_01455 [archaeon]|nr:hypothetical protein [archaeon]